MAIARRPWWRSKWVIACLVGVAVLAVAFGTGNVSFYFVSGDPPTSNPVPANNVPEVGAVANGSLHGTQLSFRYPPDWQVLNDPSIMVNGASTGATIIGLGTGNEVLIETHRLRSPVTSSNFPAFGAIAGQAIRQHAEASGDRIVNGPTEATLGGLPAVEYVLQGPGPANLPAIEHIAFTARGTTEFWVDCFSTRRHRAVIGKGCDQVIRTFRIHSG
jgi:hypothetical protein